MNNNSPLSNYKPIYSHSFLIYSTNVTILHGSINSLSLSHSNNQSFPYHPSHKHSISISPIIHLLLSIHISSYK